mgnify:CR=1 FL=1|tara:strand:- start:2175 stop:4619 length:2445 start_codon:yes stop_codon:yes gene_type:complete
MDILVQSIREFNNFCEATQASEPRHQLNLNENTLHQYRHIINNIVTNFYQIQGAHQFLIVLYTESLFDSIMTINYFRNNCLLNYDQQFIAQNPTGQHPQYYDAIRRENRPDMNRQSGTSSAASLVDHRAYRRHEISNLSVCEERSPSYNLEDTTTNIVYNIGDAYTVYVANLIVKELVELRNGSTFSIPNMLYNNQKFFNKIAIIRNQNTIINNNLFNIDLKKILETIDNELKDQQLIAELNRSHNVGTLQHIGNRQDPAYWGNKMNSTVVWHTHQDPQIALVTYNSNVWIANGKNQSRLNELPDEFLTDYQEYGAVLLNAHMRNNSEFKIYMPILRSGFSSDLSNNSTISYYHKFSHQLFAGGYQTLAYGPIFYINNNYIYNSCLLDSFSLNYRTSPPMNRLFTDLQLGNINPNAMAGNQRDPGWRNSYDDLMERYISIVRSVEYVCNMAKGMQQIATMNGVLPLIHRLSLFHGSSVNIFKNGNITYSRGFLSCTTTIDIALTFANRGREIFVYLILIEPGEHCPFINMGNMFREFAIPPGVMLTYVGHFTLPNLHWRQPAAVNGANITYIFVRPTMGNFIGEFARLIDIANMWQPHLGNRRTCFDNCFTGNNPQGLPLPPAGHIDMARYFGMQNVPIVAQHTQDLINILQGRISANPIQIGGNKGKKTTNSKFNKMFKEFNGGANMFGIKNDSLFKRSKVSKSKMLTSTKVDPVNAAPINKVEERKHFNSFTEEKLFETFSSKTELKKFVSKENEKIKKQILFNKEDRKTNSIKLFKNNLFDDLSLLDNDKVFNEETNKILNLAGKGFKSKR